jgi:FKBP-type peptidyl-prolyl cis-trans isomerase
MIRLIYFSIVSAFAGAIYGDEGSKKLLDLGGFSYDTSKEVALKGFGTGFSINPKGYIITANHVIEKSDFIRVVFKKSNPVDAVVVKREKSLDLAILKVKEKTPSFLSVTSRTAGLGDDVYTIGYPDPQILGFNQKFTKGSISALTGLGDYSFRYQVSVPSQPGNSGGPLVCENSGEVLGIIISGLKEQSDYSPQLINYALKSGFIKPIIDALEINTEKTKLNLNKNEKRKRVVESTCLIITAIANKETEDPVTIIPSNNPSSVPSKSKNDLNAEFFSSIDLKKNIIKDKSGLRYEIIKQGEMNTFPTNNDAVEVHYHGTLIDGTVFDSSVNRGAPATFPLNAVIKGFSNGIKKIGVGGKVNLYIPPELGYGNLPKPGGIIKPNDILIFEIELLRILGKENKALVKEETSNPLNKEHKWTDLTGRTIEAKFVKLKDEQLVLSANGMLIFLDVKRLQTVSEKLAEKLDGIRILQLELEDNFKPGVDCKLTIKRTTIGSSPESITVFVDGESRWTGGNQAFKNGLNPVLTFPKGLHHIKVEATFRSFFKGVYTKILYNRETYFNEYSQQLNLSF